MTARSTEGENASIFGHEAGLSFGIWQTQYLRIFLDPLYISLGIKEFDETFGAIVDHGNLEAVFPVVRAPVGRVGDVCPCSDEHAGRFEIVVVVKVVLYAFFCFSEDVRFVGLSVEDGARVRCVYVGVKRGDGRVGQRELDVQERRYVCSEGKHAIVVYLWEQRISVIERYGIIFDDSYKSLWSL